MRNVGNWRVKETDRMAAMQKELTKLGATVTVSGDDITITWLSGTKSRRRRSIPMMTTGCDGVFGDRAKYNPAWTINDLGLRQQDVPAVL
ncbi:MAG: hypothetical protein R3C45_04640 [Phycisphaerales bacterium]